MRSPKPQALPGAIRAVRADSVCLERRLAAVAMDRACEERCERPFGARGDGDGVKESLQIHRDDTEWCQIGAEKSPWNLEDARGV